MSELRADDLISLDLIRDLVRFNTVSRNSNLELIEYVRRYLDGLGVESRIIPGPDGDKACIYATIGPKDRGGVMLSGHTDVVSGRWRGMDQRSVFHDGPGWPGFRPRHYRHEGVRGHCAGLRTFVSGKEAEDPDPPCVLV